MTPEPIEMVDAESLPAGWKLLWQHIYDVYEVEYRLYVLDHEQHLVLKSPLHRGRNGFSMLEGSQLALPKDELYWVVNAIRRMLLPPSLGGPPPESSRLGFDQAAEKLWMRRTYNCHGSNEMGYDIGNSSREDCYGDSPQNIYLMDRILFTAGLYDLLIDLAEQYHQQDLAPAPDPHCRGTRPQWLIPEDAGDAEG